MTGRLPAVFALRHIPKVAFHTMKGDRDAFLAHLLVVVLLLIVGCHFVFPFPCRLPHQVRVASPRTTPRGGFRLLTRFNLIQNPISLPECLCKLW